MQFSLINTDEGRSVTVYAPGRDPLVASQSHPKFDAIVEGVLADDESVLDLFDISVAAGTRFERLTERVTAANGRLYLDGVEVNNTISGAVIRFLEEGVDDWMPLVAFFENVQANPNDHSRTMLYDWLQAEAFSLTPDGMIVGYKSVRKTDDGYESLSSGRAISNGVAYEGRIPNPVGAVVEMPRDEVEHNPSAPCSVGLHVGTYGYASTFSGDTVLEVHVNPRDVVSVPTDSSGSKMRVCRYNVVKAVTKKYESVVVTPKTGSKPKAKGTSRVKLTIKAVKAALTKTGSIDKAAKDLGAPRDTVRAFAKEKGLKAKKK